MLFDADLHEARALEDANRRRVPGRRGGRHADDAVLLERPVDAGAGRFARVAVPLPSLFDAVADLRETVRGPTAKD